MFKKFGLVAVLVILVAIAWLFFNAGKKVDNPDTSTTGTTSTKPLDYQSCVSAGGIVSNDLAPSRCLLDDNAYYDGDY